MMITCHRINDIPSLRNVPCEYGIEIDVRDYGCDLVLSHDPFTKGEKLENFLKHYKHKFIIVNIKCEGLEYRVLELFSKYQITDYFFLDSSFPYIVKLLNNGERNIAVRFSEYESIETLLNMKNKVKWVWVDCFNIFPLTKQHFDLLKSYNYNICIVSPDLQSQQNKIVEYKNYMQENNIIPDMICCKMDNINKWI